MAIALSGLALRHQDPGAGDLCRRLVFVRAFIAGAFRRDAEVLRGRLEVAVLISVDAQKDMGDGVAAVPFDEPVREAPRFAEFAGGKCELEGLVQNFPVARILLQRAPVIERGIVAVARGTRHIPREIAAEQGGSVHDLAYGERACPWRGWRVPRTLCPLRRDQSAIASAVFFKLDSLAFGAVSMESIEACRFDPEL